MNRTPWPSNIGAYSRALLGAPFTALLGAAAAASYSPGDVVAAIASGAGDLGVLLATEHPTGWRRHAKAACAWAGTTLGALVLAVSSYEGDGGVSLAGLGQLDAHDALVIAALTLKATLQTVVPNARAAAAAVVVDVADVAAPVTADHSGETLGHTRLETQVLQALTPERIAALQALTAAAQVPAQPAAPAAEASTGRPA